MKRSVDFNATTAWIFEAGLGNHFVPRQLVDSIEAQEDYGRVLPGCQGDSSRSLLGS
jgi:hypothetical protein